MKNKILFTISLLIYLTGNTCPDWHIGDVFIIDNAAKPLNAKLWKVYYNSKNIKDSFLIKIGYHYIYSEKKYSIDTVINRRCLYASDFWSKSKSYLRIQAEGFSDVIIKDFEFANNSISSINDPKLIVKMYPATYIKNGTNIHLITEYVCNKGIIVYDSIVLDMKEYIENINISKVNKTGNPEQKLLLVETYPNPVSDILYLNINYTVKEPWTIVITDETGKEILRTNISNSFNTIDLSGFVNGFYITTLYNHQKLPIYNRRFLLAKK